MAGLAGAQAVQPPGPVAVEWDSRTVSGGRSVVSGYVHNRQTMRLENIRVRVEMLDASSRAVGTRLAYVAGTVPAHDRGYFEVRLPASESYRVTIDSFDWAGCGNG
jgi:hypothetical protein